MYLINNLKVNIKEDFSNLDKLLSQAIGLKAYNVILKKRSIDSRKKGEPTYGAYSKGQYNKTRKHP